MKKNTLLMLGTIVLSSSLLTSPSVYVHARGVSSQMTHITNRNVNHSMGDFLKGTANLRRLETSGISAAELGRPSKDFIDISSHNGDISKEEFQMMKDKYGIKGVIVKLTEGSSYRNLNAPMQIANAKAVGLRVSAYHFSWFDSPERATEEAEYFLDYAKELNLDLNTSLVNDYESVSSPVESDPTTNSLRFAEVLKTAGYENVYHYSSKTWFSSVLDINKLGQKNCWVAEWPLNPTADNPLHTENAAWQWASDLYFPELGDSRYFDISTDYLNAFS